MDHYILSKYLNAFAHLHRTASKEHGLAPHKPILLLAVLDEIERGAYPNNLITVTPELAASFRVYWQALVPEGHWHEKMVYPFRHLLQDGFWDLVKDGVSLTSQQVGDVYALNQLSRIIDVARLTDDLWQLLQDKGARNALRTHLSQTYFGLSDSEIQKQQPTEVFNYEAERLKAEAQSKFRIKKAKESGDEIGYYVRHTLFPRVVRGLYEDSCAVCALNVRDNKGSAIVDGAHIVRFAESHNDDPRNGIALCKNHHWGFDEGWFSISKDYRLLVSPHLQNGLTYVIAGGFVQLPTDSQYAPDPTALARHRKRHGFL